MCKIQPKSGKLGKGSGSTLGTNATWAENLDLEAFSNDVIALGKELKANEGQDDVDHLYKIMFWGNCFSFMGFALAWMSPYWILPSVVLSIGVTSRWVMIGHHVTHGGYDSTAPKRFNRKTFALHSLWRRVSDWMDVMRPDAWALEHNHLHHYKLNEEEDPDLVQRNFMFLRESELSLPLKCLYFAAVSVMWKYVYYAPNTFRVLRMHEMKRAGQPVKKETQEAVGTVSALIAGIPDVSLWDFWCRSIGPYIVWRFLLNPLPYLVLGMYLTPETPTWMFFNAMWNAFIAEIISNVHTFVIIVPNHAGDDMYRYDTHVDARSPEFFLRQVVSSANYSAGNDVVDFLHGWLNYQIEHHCWPSLSMLSYQRAMPEMKRICEKHGVPYVQHSVFWRTKKTFDVAAGLASMPMFPEGVLK